MRVRWLRAALKNLEDIAAHIAQDNPAAARDTVALIIRSVDQLAANPALDLSRPGRVLGTRELVVSASYIVPYRVKQDELQVLRVMHARQHWPKRFT